MQHFTSQQRIMSLLNASTSAIKRGLSSVSGTPRMLNPRTLAPTVNQNASAGMKVSQPCSRFSAPFLMHIHVQVLAVLYKGGDAAKQEPRLLGTVENQVCDVMSGV